MGLKDSAKKYKEMERQRNQEERVKKGEGLGEDGSRKESTEEPGGISLPLHWVLASQQSRLSRPALGFHRTAQHPLGIMCPRPELGADLSS